MANPKPADPLDALIDDEDSHPDSNVVEQATSQSPIVQPVPTPTPPSIEQNQQIGENIRQPVPTPIPPSIENKRNEVVSQPVPTPIPPPISVEPSNVPLPNLTERPEPEPVPVARNPQVDLAAAALDAASEEFQLTLEWIQILIL